MRPEQERVKNLLSDTVTLLCKNGLTYREELRVEALIGITVDNNDVFIVHINERFEPKGGKSSEELRISSLSKQGVLTPPTRCENQPSLAGPVVDGSNLTKGEFNQMQRQILQADDCTNPQQGSGTNAVSDQTESTVTPKELSAIEQADVVIKIEDTGIEAWSEPTGLRSPDAVAQRSAMIAGQRRSPPKRPFQSSQHDADAMRQTYSSFNLIDSVKNNGKLWDSEPPLKRQSIDDYYLVPTEQNEMAAHMMFDPSNNPLFSPDGSRAGCSSWSSGSASTPRSGLQSDMIATLGLQGSEARYPTLSGLQSHTHRQLLATHLVDPVINANSQMCAFRLSWYGKAGCDLESAWTDIVAHQRHCDRLVTEFPGVAVVGSAFTGTVSGLKKGGADSGPGLRKTYPGLAYVVVPGGDDFVYPNLLRRLEQNNIGGIMKPMLGLHEQTRPKLCSALYLVFKDNVDSGYVQRMVDISAGTHGYGSETGGGNGHYPMVRFSVRGDELWPSMVELHSKLQEAGFKSTLHRLDD